MTDNEIFANEILCIRRRASGRCNGGTDCNTCDLLMDETEIIAAYQRAMKNNDLINRQKAEIERLQKMQQLIKTEAIKEFAEKLKGVFGFDEMTGAVIKYHIDNLIKEMEGEKHG